MLKKKPFIITLLVLLGLVIAYDLYYFTREKTPPAAEATGQLMPQRTPKKVPGVTSLPRTTTKSPTRKSAPVRAAELDSMEFAEILTKIAAKNDGPKTYDFPRDPFRSPAPEASSITTQPEGDYQEELSGFEKAEFVLSAIIGSADNRWAIINNQLIREGEQLDLATVTRVGDDEIELEQAGMTRVISLVAQSAK